ncbi:MAG: hypothetical protein COU28_01320 [Candidatus Magasanikbacteria bacterium CG10_big_fil_rev_8_21_14_0_10_36_16]|uniref:GrpB family protein n=1 Tax=Candidatus Magasanikbacteria bacterium CG10_big_fil_rev_8_21_14_0_10_36_16 TaxID=1974645 RepID=A0A2H0TZ48_9BACT|nr:MAG: hypothetical protein COU28_01320 [Candidatus Magasanikbacteria bacterium CG10_big_fil_rev_8_21_14_0_10_36_16]
MLGLKRGTVKLSENHEEWKNLFEIEKKLLMGIFGDLVLRIEHIGSTAIPGVPAKPIIDIRLAVNSIDDEYIKQFVEPLEKLGYYYMHKFDDRHFFAKGPEEKRTHHLSIVEYGSDSWKDSILFRDYLINNDSACGKYSKLKVDLAKKFANDRPSYTKAKEEFIEDIIKRLNLCNFYKSVKSML